MCAQQHTMNVTLSSRQYSLEDEICHGCKHSELFRRNLLIYRLLKWLQAQCSEYITTMLMIRSPLPLSLSYYAVYNPHDNSKSLWSGSIKTNFVSNQFHVALFLEFSRGVASGWDGIRFMEMAENELIESSQSKCQHFGNTHTGRESADWIMLHTRTKPQ